MKSLLLRIFLLCWITNVLVLAAFMFLATRAEILSGEQSPRGFFQAQVGAAGKAAVIIMSLGGKHAVNEYLDTVERTTGWQVRILDESARPILDLSLPEQAQRIAEQIRDGAASKDRTPEPGAWLGDFAEGPDGRRFIVVGSFSPPRIARLFPILGPMTLPLFVILVTAGIIAFVLAHYVTLPVTRLRAATSRFAAGELDARAGPPLTRRRDAIGDLGREFDAMASRVGLLILEQQQLLQDVSHELRSPLARVSVALGIARRKAGPSAEDSLLRIEQEVEQLNELISQLLTLSRLNSQQLHPARSDFDLLTIVEAVAADADFESQERGCKVRLIRGHHSVVNAVEPLLRSAIENVLRNAIAYTARGTAVEVEVTQRSDTAEPQAVVSVRDHGPGVPEEYLPAIFEPFRRVEGARDRGRGGVGLGLAIAARAVAIHGGTIRASNASNGGLIVEITMPALRHIALTCSDTNGRQQE
jgi:two-component system sensor histidine kinase CpxA